MTTFYLLFFRQCSPPSISVRNLKFLAFDPILHFFLLALNTVHTFAKIKVSSFVHLEILGDPKNVFFSRDMTQFCIFSLVPTAIHLCAKLDVFSFYRSRDIRGSQNSISWSLDPHMTHFDIILHLLVSTHCRPSLCQI